MPKILILEACLVNLHDDRGGVDAEAGALLDVDADQAGALARIGRALYTTKSDDPSKGRYTAPLDVVKQAQTAAAKAKRAAQEGVKANGAGGGESDPAGADKSNGPEGDSSQSSGAGA